MNTKSRKIGVAPEQEVETALKEIKIYFMQMEENTL